MPGSKPSVSVIIPTFNQTSDILHQAVCSALKQKIPVEVIVVNDGGLIDLPEQANLKIKIVNSKKRQGPGLARNLGLKYARGKFIAFLDSDDFWQDDFLDRSISYLEKFPEKTGVLCLSHKIFMPWFRWRFKLRLEFFNWFKDILTFVSYLLCNGNLSASAPFLGQISHLVFRRSEIQRIKFSQTYKYCEDWKFLLEVMKQGKLGILLTRMVNFRYSPQSNTFTVIKSDKESKLNSYKRLVKEIENSVRPDIFLKLFKIYINKFLITDA